ncbi:MAG TPA: hypothetical protein VMB85_07895 [Bryobacteraceae bacterium]|jgi:hypothetical protein|nr:hypothetical protein [Bryobacteraceae bacterium]
MAFDYNSTCTFDGNAFDAVEIMVELDTPPTSQGMPTMGGLTASVRVVVDPSDTTNCPYSLISTLFSDANLVTNQKIKQVKLEFWQDPSKQNALCSYQFQGWISGFQTVNPAGAQTNISNQSQVLNNMLVIDITPQLNQTNQPNLSFSN